MCEPWAAPTAPLGMCPSDPAHGLPPRHTSVIVPKALRTQMDLIFISVDEPTLSTEELFGCGDAELDARVAKVRAKIAVVAARYGTDEAGLVEIMDLGGQIRRHEIMAEITAAQIDPRTGSGLS